MNDADARKLVRACLIEMGLDVSDPIDMQADFAFLRRQRQASEKFGMAVKIAGVGALITAAVGALWAGLSTPPH